MLSRRLLTSFVLLIWCAVPSIGQLPKRLERCLPNPTLAQEIRDMQKEVEPQKITLTIVSVEFDEKSAIPADLQDEINAELRRGTFEEDADSDYLKEAAGEIAEVGVRGPLQDRGYFRVLPSAKLKVLKAEGADIQVAATVSAELGPQYWSGEIQFVTADPNKSLSQAPEVLRRLIPLERGDLFSVDALREGLRNLTRLYGKEGYIDMTAEPEFDITESTHIIDMTFRIDEQKRYWVGQIEILGLDELAKEQFLNSLPQPGETFDREKLEESFKKNKTVLPVDASPYEDVQVHRRTKEGKVSLLFDFRPCPGQTEIK